MNPIARILSNWFTRMRAASLICRLVKMRDATSLQAYLAHLIDHDIRLGLEKKNFRETLFGMSDWQIQGACGDFLFATVERYLVENCRSDHRSQWQSWIRLCRLAGRKIDVTGPRMTAALREAQDRGVLQDLPAEERGYLLGLYRDSYAAVLGDQQDLTTPDLLPVLLSYASVLHEVGSDELAQTFLKRLSGSLRVCPRSLGALSDEESLAYPECGVGSPHRIAVTVYHDSGSTGPARITGAGATADATLNAQVFTNIFAAALACNAEPTLVTTAGWSLSMTQEESLKSDRERLFLSAVLTPAGPGEPMTGTPTMGMTPEEALSIISDSFDRLQEATGLVRVMRWESRDADYVEERIREALAVCRDGVRVLKSEPLHTEGAAVIHVMPLLCRNSRNEVVPVEIDIPYESLGPKNVFDLLRKGRSTYMLQLISAARSREAYAKKAWVEQEHAIANWNQHSDEEKQEICKLHPTVTITMAYNWDLGITVTLKTPEEMPRMVYEHEQRPQIRESAKLKETEFAALGTKLENMNQPGGHADMLTFKLLVDSMIRRAVLAIPDGEFQDEYLKWINISSAPTWAAIAAWAKDHGLPPESLAADNVCFNAQVQPGSGRVRLQPMVMIDLHDFLVRIDGRKGIMEVFPGGKTATLADCLVPDKANGIHKPADMHARFVKWMKQRFSVDEARQSGRQGLNSEIMADVKIGVMVRLERAKHALLRGNADEALNVIADIRRSDMAPVYLWGAVAEQYKYLCDLPLSDIPAGAEERRERLLQSSFAVLIEFLKSESPVRQPGQVESDGAPPMSAEARARSEQARSLTPRQAQDYLGQLRSCDPKFISRLISDKPNIPDMEKKYFALSQEEVKRYSAAFSALSALELLDLAEAIKDTACALPFSGCLTAKIKQDIQQLVQQKQSLSLASPPSCLELDELQKML